MGRAWCAPCPSRGWRDLRLFLKKRKGVSHVYLFPCLHHHPAMHVTLKPYAWPDFYEQVIALSRDTVSWRRRALTMGLLLLIFVILFLSGGLPSESKEGCTHEQEKCPARLS